MDKECWAVLLAAGRGTRMAAATGGTAKQFLRWKGFPLWWHSATALAASPLVSGIVFVFPPGQEEQQATELKRLVAKHDLGVRMITACGGRRRQDSTRNALEKLPGECSMVLVHDSARPFLSTALVTRVADALRKSAPDGIAGVIPGLPVTDTIKQVAGDAVLSTPDRSSLRAVQTPQAFPMPVLLEAHRIAEREQWEVTDDASIIEHCGLSVMVIEGEEANMKITRPEDLARLDEEKTAMVPCCGYGYDVHAYGGTRPFILGGVPIPSDILVEAHSDGDVLLHALMDAILGCIGGGDIGRLFSDNDPAYDNASSSVLLDRVLALATEKGLRLTHVDLTVVAQKPKLAPSADSIRRNVARLLDLPLEHVGFKATTEEHLGFTGELRGIKAVALATGLI